MPCGAAYLGAIDEEDKLFSSSTRPFHRANCAAPKVKAESKQRKELMDVYRAIRGIYILAPITQCVPSAGSKLHDLNMDTVVITGV